MTNLFFKANAALYKYTGYKTNYLKAKEYDYLVEHIQAIYDSYGVKGPDDVLEFADIVDMYLVTFRIHHGMEKVYPIEDLFKDLER